MKILVGLSGGVDSAVAAYLLKKEGHEVVGCFMRNWDAMSNNDLLGNPTLNEVICPQEQDYNDAKAVAEILGIELLRVDFIKEYWDNVFSYFLSEYELARTPNPDIFCNKFIKFDSFLKDAMENGFDKIAMGHYAKLVEKDGISHLCKAEDRNKDQSYFLCELSQKQLAKAVFPLGNIEKPEVRKIAKDLNLETVMNKKDSTGVCFIGERDFKEFLKNYLPAKKGNIVDISSSNIVGKHDGVVYYTIGQRRGLGIGGIKGTNNSKWFVCAKNVKENILYVSSQNEDEYLIADEVLVEKCVFNSCLPNVGSTIGVKFRYRQEDQMCVVKEITNDTILLKITNTSKAVTPGQIAAFYDGDICLGGGTIEKVYRNNKEVEIYK